MESIHNFFQVPEGESLMIIVIFVIRRAIALIGSFVIAWGAIVAIYQFIANYHRQVIEEDGIIDMIRIRFGRTIILGLEFIVASDIIATTYTPNYYSMGILASLVAIRTLLNYFMNLEIRALLKKS